MKPKETEGQEVVIPDGYEIYDLLDTDEAGYDLGEPMKKEEVKIRIE